MLRTAEEPRAGSAPAAKIPTVKLSHDQKWVPGRSSTPGRAPDNSDDFAQLAPGITARRHLYFVAALFAFAPQAGRRAFLAPSSGRNPNEPNRHMLQR